MKPWRSLLALPALAALLTGAAFVTGSGTFAAFDGSTSNASSFSSAADWTPPSASASVIAKQAGNEPGYIRQGGGYYVYANVADTGNPASGVQTVTANVSSLDTGQTAVPLNAGSFSLYGVTYNRRSNLLTANATLSPTGYSYSMLLRDNGTNQQTQNGFNVTVDNTVPAASDYQSTNVGGGTAGRPEPGDTITFTYDDVIDTGSVLAGWTGGSANVVVRILAGSPNRLQVWNSSDNAQLPLTNGTGVGLQRNGWVSTGTARFGATGTPSTMVRSGNAITITLGTASGTAAATVTQNARAQWTPSASATDRAGNASTTTAVNEATPNDPEF